MIREFKGYLENEIKKRNDIFKANEAIRKEHSFVIDNMPDYCDTTEMEKVGEIIYNNSALLIEINLMRRVRDKLGDKEYIDDYNLVKPYIEDFINEIGVDDYSEIINMGLYNNSAIMVEDDRMMKFIRNYEINLDNKFNENKILISPRLFRLNKDIMVNNNSSVESGTLLFRVNKNMDFNIDENQRINEVREKYEYLIVDSIYKYRLKSDDSERITINFSEYSFYKNKLVEDVDYTPVSLLECDISNEMVGECELYDTLDDISEIYSYDVNKSNFKNVVDRNDKSSYNIFNSYGLNLSSVSYFSNYKNIGYLKYYKSENMMNREILVSEFSNDYIEFYKVVGKKVIKYFSMFNGNVKIAKLNGSDVYKIIKDENIRNILLERLCFNKLQPLIKKIDKILAKDGGMCSTKIYIDEYGRVNVSVNDKYNFIYTGDYLNSNNEYRDFNREITIQSLIMLNNIYYSKTYYYKSSISR